MKCYELLACVCDSSCSCAPRGDRPHTAHPARAVVDVLHNPSCHWPRDSQVRPRTSRASKRSPVAHQAHRSGYIGLYQSPQAGRGTQTRPPATPRRTLQPARAWTRRRSDRPAPSHSLQPARNAAMAPSVGKFIQLRKSHLPSATLGRWRKILTRKQQLSKGGAHQLQNTCRGD